MSTLTRLNQDRFVVNAELIKTVESTPDTMITLVSGEHIIVRESLQEVVKRDVEYSRSMRAIAM